DELDEYNENQAISDAQKIQALESFNILIQEISSVTQKNQASTPEEIQLTAQSPNNAIAMSDSTTKDIRKIPFKPPCRPDFPLYSFYRKRRKPLSNVNNIVIQLPP
ncbi:12984_t:CDS:2, partial [Gigaspora rosea]